MKRCSLILLMLKATLFPVTAQAEIVVSPSNDDYFAKSVARGSLDTPREEVTEFIDANQKMNLDTPVNERFALTDRIWPSGIGEASVCLWNDDKIAAASITIDDNIEADHSWWLSMQTRYDLDFTWFVIIDIVSGWDKYQTLIDAGNEVQGHDDCDINTSGDEAYRAALLNTKDQINANVTSNSCVTYAYPCGEAGKSEVARDVYISMRGVYGIMNQANETDYLNVNSRSATNDTHDIRVLLDEQEKLWGTSYYRGWLSTHYHSISAIKDATESFLSGLSDKSDSIWNGRFSDVAKYGQERDSHTLTVDEVNGSAIKFTLVDEMDDSYFDFPLTVKIRVDNTWDKVEVTQEGFPGVEASLVGHEGNVYALVKAAPDKGQVTLTSVGNNAPVITTIQDQKTYEDSTLLLDISATDPDGDPIVFSEYYLPDFVVMTDHGDGSGILTINPQVGDAGIYTDLTVFASDGLDSVSTVFSLVVDTVSTSVEFHKDIDFVVYPNPGNGKNLFIQISSDLPLREALLEIVDLNGKVIIKREIAAGERRIPVTDLDGNKKGLFLVRITSKQFTVSKKLIIE